MPLHSALAAVGRVAAREVPPFGAFTIAVSSAAHCLLPRLQEMRSRTGRPHWIILDEAHHLLPTSWQAAPLTLPHELGGVLMIAVHPDKVSPAILEAVDTALALGEPLQMAEGVDEETWLHHLRQRDFSKWFRSVVKDDALAAEAEQIDRRGSRESRSGSATPSRSDTLSGE